MNAELGLFGRDAEVARVRRLVADPRTRGGALLIEGPPGIGKSALVAEAVRAAGDALQVMRVVGVQSESHLPFAGLHQLLRPVVERARELPGPQRDALAAAFGMAAGTAPESFLIGLGTLGLLSEVAHERPLLVVVDDAQWLDRPSAATLAFVARRVQADPIVMLVTVRDGYRTALHEAGLPVLALERLADAASQRLLEARYPTLAQATRARVEAEAEGNPLALLEFAASPETLVPVSGSPLPGTRTLTARLEQALAARLTELPPATRTLVRVAAADEGSPLATVLAAGSLVDGADRTLRHLLPAVEARLVELDEGELRFRHPLVRSAVYQAADVAERHAVHRAMAEVFAADADRRAWHAAAAAHAGPDATLAGDLEAAGRRALERGAVPTAAAAFERGAAFAEDPQWRGGLLLAAASAAAELGRAETVNALLRQAEALPLGLREQAQALLIGDAFRAGRVGDRARIRALRDTGTRLTDEGEHDLALALFMVAATRCYLSSLPDEGRDVVHEAERIGLAASDPRLLFIQAFGAPIARDATVLSHVAAPVGETDADPAAHLRGAAICLAGDAAAAMPLLTASAARLREEGRVGLLARAQVMRAWAAFELGDVAVAITAAEEAVRLDTEIQGGRIWEPGALAARAAIAAVRGDAPTVTRLTAEIERLALPSGARMVLGLGQLARGMLSLGAGRHAEAYAHLRRIDDPDDPAWSPRVRLDTLADHVEAAVLSGHRAEAVELMARLGPIARSSPSPWLQAGLALADAHLAVEREGDAAFTEARRRPLMPFPLYRARLDLAHGQWLRRNRRTLEARDPLRTARDTFESLGARDWAQRARRELRAAGEGSAPRRPDSLDVLTPQELQIVQLAAQGLSNRDIAERMYLSRRTVESHLYRVFPKLGVTARAQLPGVLGDRIGAPV